MKAIHKYPLKVANNSQLLEIPDGAEILCAKDQYGQICIWAFVDPEAPKVFIEILKFGTGEPISDPQKLSYIDTVASKISDFEFVWHIYRRMIP